MRHILIFLIAISFMFSSCAQEEFDVSSLSLRGRIDVTLEDGKEAVVEVLRLSASFSVPDESYTFRLVSPDGSLRWEGGLSGSDILSSDVLELTPGASFPEGDYSVLFYSTGGTELQTAVSYHRGEDYPCFRGDALSGTAHVTEFRDDGSVVAEGERDSGYERAEETVHAIMTTTDRYGNSISVTQSFLP